MKNLHKLSVGFLSLFLLVSPSFSQGKEAAIYLKDGGIRRGLIVELIPGEMVTLKTAYDEVFVIQMADISKIVMEEDATPTPKKDKPTPPTSTSVKLEKWYIGFQLGIGGGSRSAEFEQWLENCPSCEKFPGTGGYGIYFPLGNQQMLIGIAVHGHDDSGQLGVSVIRYMKRPIGQGRFLRIDLGTANVSKTLTWDSGRKETFRKSGVGMLMGLGHAIPVSGGNTRIVGTLFYATRPGYSTILGLSAGWLF